MCDAVLYFPFLSGIISIFTFIWNNPPLLFTQQRQYLPTFNAWMWLLLVLLAAAVLHDWQFAGQEHRGHGLRKERRTGDCPADYACGKLCSSNNTRRPTLCSFPELIITEDIIKPGHFYLHRGVS